MMPRNLPPDCTRTALAQAAALRALVTRRQHPRRHADGSLEQLPVTRLSIEEAMQELLDSRRYHAVPWPHYTTVLMEVRRQASEGVDLLDLYVAPRGWRNYLDPARCKRCPDHGERLLFVAVMGTQAFLRCPRWVNGVTGCTHEEVVPCGYLPTYGYEPAEPFMPGGQAAWQAG